MTSMRMFILLFAAVLMQPFVASVQADEQPAATEAPASATPAESPAESPADCRAVLSQLQELENKLSRELRTVKRDIAALNQTVEEPGMQEVFAGIGYILGLFGIAAFMASRRQQRSNDR